MFHLNPELIVSTWREVVAEHSYIGKYKELKDHVEEYKEFVSETSDGSWYYEDDHVRDDTSNSDQDKGPGEIKGMFLNRIPEFRICSPEENGEGDFHESPILPEDQKLLSISKFDLDTRKHLSCQGDAICNTNSTNCRNYGTFRQIRDELLLHSKLGNDQYSEKYLENVYGAYPKIKRFGSPIESGPPTNIFNSFGTYSNMTMSMDSTRKKKCFKYFSDIQKLIECDVALDMDDLVDLEDIFEQSFERIGATLCALGDKMVKKLEDWVDRLPILYDIPSEVYSDMLCERWFELTVLITTASVALQGTTLKGVPSDRLYKEFLRQMKTILKRLFQRKNLNLGVEAQIEEIMEIIIEIIYTFVKIGLTREDLVCMKMVLLLTQGKDNIRPFVKKGHSYYSAILFRQSIERYPNQAFRYRELVRQQRQISTAAHVLIQSKMVYLPFFLKFLEVS